MMHFPDLRSQIRPQASMPLRDNANSIKSVYIVANRTEGLTKIQPVSHQDGNEHRRQDESDLPAEGEIRLRLGLKGADEKTSSTVSMTFVCLTFVTPPT